MCFERLALGLLGLALAVGWPAPSLGQEGAAASRPPRLHGDARAFSRVVRPAQPRTSVGVGVVYARGAEADHLRRDQWRWALVLEGAYDDVGAFLEIPLTLDSVATEGLYGPGEGSSAGLGDLSVGVDIALLHGRPLGIPLVLGMGAQVILPTSDEREVVPRTPFVPAPPVSTGPGLLAYSGGLALAAGPWHGLSVQLNADMQGRRYNAPGRPDREEDRLFGGVALVVAYLAPFGWITPIVQVDGQLEIIGGNPLRQIIFLSPALRVRPHGRLAFDLGARIPLGEESQAAQQVSAGLTITVGLGPLGEEAW